MEEQVSPKHLMWVRFLLPLPWLVSQVVKTGDFHSPDISSILIRVTTFGSMAKRTTQKAATFHFESSFLSTPSIFNKNKGEVQ